MEQDGHDLVRENARLQTALNNMAQGLCMFDGAGKLLVRNQSYLDMYGLSADVVRPGVTLRGLLEHSISVGNHLGRSVEEVQSALVKDLLVPTSTVFHNVLDNGRTIAVSVEPLGDGGWVATHEDITDRQKAEARIAYLARHDSLTGLPNRTVFLEELQALMERRRQRGKLAVFCLDLDRFKAVNDTLGHGIGDILLKEAARRLQACLREVDCVARFGGDEFTIIQVDAEQPEGATTLAQRLINAIGIEYVIEGHHVNVGVSIGIAIAPDDADGPDQALRNADLALYRAKQEGRGQYRFFAADMDERMQARRNLELDLRRALTNGEFELAYQPLVEVASKRILAFEALLRWNHPSRGLVMPAMFIPVAEECGQIGLIGEWVLREACRAAAAWPDDVSVAVNLSPAQFRQSNLVNTVVSALAASGLPPERLELEITEGVLLANSEATLSTLHQLRELGVRIAMDDFGTGYSSLSYLRAFPFDKIKIDQSFVRDVAIDPEAMAIVRAVTQLGNSLGMETTAEGIETEQQLAHLKDQGCSQVQGYLLGHPMPIGQALLLIHDQAAEGSSKAA